MSITNISIFDINHIIDTICESLSTTDINNCLHVNKHWYSVFLPSTWKTVQFKDYSGKLVLTKEQIDVLNSNITRIRHLKAEGITPESLKDVALTCRKLKSLAVYDVENYNEPRPRATVDHSSASIPRDNLFSIAISTLAVNPGLRSLELHVRNDDDENLRKSMVSTLANHKSLSKLRWDFSACHFLGKSNIMEVPEVKSIVHNLPESIVELDLIFVADGYWEPCSCCGIPDFSICEHSSSGLSVSVCSPAKILNLKVIRIDYCEEIFPLYNSVISPLLEHSPFLESLFLPGLEGTLVESLVDTLNKHCPHLRILDICNLASDENLAQLIRGIRNIELESLTFGFNDTNLDNTILALAGSRFCSTLKKLKLRGLAKNINDDGIVRLLVHLKSLNSLTLTSVYDYGSDFHAGVTLRSIVTAFKNNPEYSLSNIESLQISMIDDIWNENDDDKQERELIYSLVYLHRSLQRLKNLKSFKLAWGYDRLPMSLKKTLILARKYQSCGERAMTADDFLKINGFSLEDTPETLNPVTCQQELEADVQLKDNFENEYNAYKTRNRRHGRYSKKKLSFKGPLNK